MLQHHCREKCGKVCMPLYCARRNAMQTATCTKVHLALHHGSKLTAGPFGTLEYSKGIIAGTKGGGPPAEAYTSAPGACNKIMIVQQFCWALVGTQSHGSPI